MTGTAQQTRTRSRYPGTRPFSDSAEDVTKFFGRSTETEELYLRVLSVPFLVQFGKSGLGKTSLLQAGLFPLLRKKTSYLPVMVRLNVAAESLTAAVQRAIAESCATENLQYVPEQVTGLWELLDDLTIWRGDLLLTPVLVFDQFEEVFTLRDEAFRRELAVELGALATGIPPRRMPPASPLPDVKLIVSLREDYLGSLEEFAAAIPGLFQERLRVEALSDASAHAAITAPALLEGDYDSPPFEFEQTALDAMVAYLKGTSGVIEPFQLQLLSRHAEKLATRKAGAQREKVTLTLADFHQGRDFAFVLDRFYRDTLQKVPAAQRRRAERLCEEGLLGAGGHRLMLEQRQIRDDYRVAPETLKTLADERLIRREVRQESVFYEISHDRLAESIRNARSTKLPRTLKRALWAAAVTIIAIVLGLSAWNRAVSNERDRAKASLGQAEGLIPFLLGEQFLGKVRDGGRSSLLKLVQERIGKEEQTPFNHGLALRNSADIEGTTGRISIAVEQYREALEAFDRSASDAAPELIQDPRILVREVARTHQRLAGALFKEGRTPEALTSINAAVASWRRVAATPRVPMEDCMSLAASLVSSAETRGQMGQTRLAVSDVESASELVFQTLFGYGKTNEKCAPPDKPGPYPDPKPLEVLSGAILARATILGESEDYDGAATLSAEASTHNPPSISARQLAFTARAMRGTSLRNASPQQAIHEYRLALSEADVLQRWDPGNRGWQRERAANQLLMALGILACLNPPAKCDPPPSRESAEAISLEALATMRTLAQNDPKNLALQKDVAWALETYAEILAPVNQVAVLDEALDVYQSSTPDDRDTDGVHSRGLLLARKAKVLAATNRPLEARKMARASADVFRKLTTRHPDNPVYLDLYGEARIQEAAILRTERNVPAALAAEADAEKLRDNLETLHALPQQRLEGLDKRDHEHRDRGEALAAEGNHPAAVREFMLSEAAVREYARARPADFGGYRDLHRTYKGLAKSQQALNDNVARGAALRASMNAAQLATWLASEDEQEPMLQNLLESRMALARFLLEGNDYPAAGAMVQEVASLAATLARGPEPDPFYVFAQGQATCILGEIRARANQAGSEEALRSGIVHLKRAVALEPNYGGYLSECERTLAKARPKR